MFWLARSRHSQTWSWILVQGWVEPRNCKYVPLPFQYLGTDDPDNIVVVVFTISSSNSLSKSSACSRKTAFFYVDWLTTVQSIFEGVLHRLIFTTTRVCMIQGPGCVERPSVPWFVNIAPSIDHSPAIANICMYTQTRSTRSTSYSGHDAKSSSYSNNTTLPQSDNSSRWLLVSVTRYCSFYTGRLIS